jgi:hypothetical protein
MVRLGPLLVRHPTGRWTPGRVTPKRCGAAQRNCANASSRRSSRRRRHLIPSRSPTACRKAGGLPGIRHPGARIPSTFVHFLASNRFHTRWKVCPEGDFCLPPPTFAGAAGPLPKRPRFRAQSERPEAIWLDIHRQSCCLAARLVSLPEHASSNREERILSTPSERPWSVFFGTGRAPVAPALCRIDAVEQRAKGLGDCDDWDTKGTLAARVKWVTRVVLRPAGPVSYRSHGLERLRAATHWHHRPDGGVGDLRPGCATGPRDERPSGRRAADADRRQD